MDTVRRTALGIVARLQAHPRLKLAVTLYRGCVRTFPGDEDVASLGKHYRLVGVYNGEATIDDLAGDIRDALEQIQREKA
jgi:hypothetical protein